MKKLTLLLTLLFTTLSLAQIDRSKIANKSVDALSELNGKLTLHFTDALNGKPIENADVTISSTGEYKTDFKGIVLFESDEMDAQLTVIFKHENYITSKFQIQVSAGTIFFNRFSVSPAMKVGNIRIILDWDKNPSDLDAHLVKEGNNGYHISYRNKHTAGDGAAQLDRDDIDSYGPETITVNTVDQNATYKYFIHDYTNKGNSDNKELANSKATIKVYDRTLGLVKVISVPTNLIGDKWEVLTIKNGKLIY
jgi:hypothetical protein